MLLFKKRKGYAANNISFRSLLLFIVLLTTVDGFAQKEAKRFSLYRDYISETLGITWRIPEGFMLDKKGLFISPLANRGPGCSCNVVLKSTDGNCLIMYSDLENMPYDNSRTLWSSEMGDMTIARSQMIYDMNAALGCIHKKDEKLIPAFDLEQYGVMRAGKDAPFNADTVFIVQIPLQKPYLEMYPYCTGIYVHKSGRPPMIFRCFFTEAGKRDESVFLPKFYKTIRYRGKQWVYDKEKAANKKYKLYLKEKRYY